MPIDLGNLKVLSPKRTTETQHTRLAWHDYYAGYSPDFAYTLLDSLKLPDDSLVLDPWNGAGTTTLAASSLGIKSVGIDLNPVPIIISKAFQVSVGDKQSILPLLSEILNKANKARTTKHDDPLEIWFDKNTASHIRNIERSIQTILVFNEFNINIKYDIEVISDIASFFYLALFKTVRKLLTDFVGSNPTWVKKPKSQDSKKQVNKSIIDNIITVQINNMLSKFDYIFKKPNEKKPDILLGDSTNIPYTKNKADIVLTSPPYCTRIDYAVYTMPELAILGFSKEDFNELRRKLIGTTTVPKIEPKALPKWGNECNNFLQNVKHHPSRASDTYYLKSHLQYFDLMYKSLTEISKNLKSDGTCIMVVQDSFYKDVHNNVPLIISQMAHSIGWKENNRFNFNAVNNMASVNKKSKQYKPKAIAVESVLVFQK